MRGRLLLRLGLSLGLLALLWQLVDGAGVMALVAGADPLWLALALGLLLVQTGLSALRWRLTARRLGQHMPLRRAVAEYFLAQTANLTLPGGIVGDAARALRARQGVGLEVAGQAVLFERLAGQAALILVTVGTAGLALLVPGGFAPPAPMVWAFALLAGGVLLASGGLRLMAMRRPRVARWGQALWHAVLHRDVRAAQALLSLGTVAANVLSFAAAAAAIGLFLPAAAIFSVIPLVLFAMLVPLAIGGWGLREGAAVMVLPLTGASPEAALAASAAFGVIFLLSSLLGLALSWSLLRDPARGIG